MAFLICPGIGFLSGFAARSPSDVLILSAEILYSVFLKGKRDGEEACQQTPTSAPKSGRGC
jgi:hypothetical protein